MKPSLRIASLALAVVIGCGAGMLVSQTGNARADTPADAVTVFVDATFGFRKDHMAKKLSESHAKFAAKGYRFAAMEAYDENGDLQGMFVTYVRN